MLAVYGTDSLHKWSGPNEINFAEPNLACHTRLRRFCSTGRDKWHTLREFKFGRASDYGNRRVHFIRFLHPSSSAEPIVPHQSTLPHTPRMHARPPLVVPVLHVVLTRSLSHTWRTHLHTHTHTHIVFASVLYRGLYPYIEFMHASSLHLGSIRRLIPGEWSVIVSVDSLRLCSVSSRFFFFFFFAAIYFVQLYPNGMFKAHTTASEIK